MSKNLPSSLTSPQARVDDGIPREIPERKGVESARIVAFLDAAQRAGLEVHAFMLYRDGAVVAEGWWHPYRPGLKHIQHSLTKSFLAAGVGTAYDDGLIRLDDRVVSFFDAELPAEVGDNLARMTVRDLLIMAAGHEYGPSGASWRTIKTSWAEQFLHQPVVNPPGREFLYNSANSYMLSAIVQKVTGQRLRDYMEPRFFAPLGIRGLEWQTCPHGVNSGGNGIDCTVSDILKLGAVHLQGGVWQGRRLLSEDWVRQATSAQLRNVVLGAFDGLRRAAGRADALDGNARVREGYGYQWWIGREGSFSAIGIFGQYSIVIPGANAVVAFNSALKPRDDRLVELVWEHLVPGMKDRPLDDDPAAFAALQARLAGLRIAPVLPGGESPLAARIDGRSYAMEPNEDSVATISVRFQGDACTFTLADHRGTHQVTAGLGREVEGMTSLTGGYLHHQYQPETTPVVATAHWAAPGRLVLDFTYIEMTFRDRLVLDFAPDGAALTFARSSNVNSTASVRPDVRGAVRSE